MVVQEEAELVGPAAMIDPRFTFQARVEDGRPRFGEIHFDAPASASPHALVNFVEHNHWRTPQIARLIISERNAKAVDFQRARPRRRRNGLFDSPLRRYC